jgi:hypothetical protein
MGLCVCINRKEGADMVWSAVYEKVYRVEGNPSRKQYKGNTRLVFK